MARMMRNKRPRPALSLTSMMDIFTTLVFFLVVNSSASSQVLQQPKQIKLPQSVVEAKPRETVVIFVGTDEVLVQGEPVARVADIRATGDTTPIKARLSELRDSVIGVSTQAVADSHEVTVLADKSIHFDVLKRIMASCTEQGYTRVSLAVVQKAGQST
jgi:biopolymer transport protein ExbD